MNSRRSIPRETLAKMVTVISPSATIQEANLAQSGHLSVYHLIIDTPTGTHDWVLKASPDGERHGIDTESHLLTIISTKTSIPVPAVIGAVETHDNLPAPFFLMERITGSIIPKREVGELSDTVLERVSHQTGRYLAELHSLKGPDGFGQVDVVPVQSLEGNRPAGELTQLTISPHQGISSATSEDWLAVLHRWTEDTLERNESTRFNDITREIRPKILKLISSLEGPFQPVLGRIDHGFHNILIEPDTGAITGMIDWAFTLSVPAAYDLVCVEANLSRDPWSVHPATPNRQELVRKSLLEGYQSAGQSVVLDQFQDHHLVYALLALIRAMNHLDMMTEFVMPDATGQQVDATAQAYRKSVTTLLARA